MGLDDEGDEEPQSERSLGSVRLAFEYEAGRCEDHRSSAK